MRSIFLFLGLAVGATACAPDSPTGLRAPDTAPSFAAAGNSGCYTVAGTISETGVFPDFVGTIDGDLVGTSSTTLSFDIRFAGAVIFSPGERTLNITGGTVPELVGVTLHETFVGLTIAEASPLIRINERTRVDAGARLGNFTTHGTLDLAPFPWVVEVEYQGIICP